MSFVPVETELTVCDPGLPSPREYIASCFTVPLPYKQTPCRCGTGGAITNGQFFSAYCSASRAFPMPGVAGNCMSCTTCTVDTAYMVSPCRQAAGGNTLCASCAVIAPYCTTTQWFRACSAGGLPAACLECSQCTGGTYAAGPCTLYADTQCAPCATCVPANTASCTSATDCTCRTGWSGANCDVCAPGYWGPRCEFACNCAVSGAPCDAATGQCACPAGYAGWNCEACAAGRFGQNCEHTCACRYGTCADGHDGTGACTCDANVGGVQCDVLQGGNASCASAPLGAALAPGAPLAPLVVAASSPLSYTLPPSALAATRTYGINASLAASCAPWLALQQSGAGGMALTLSGAPSAAQVAALMIAAPADLLCPILITDASDGGVNTTLGVTLRPVWQPAPPMWAPLAPQAVTMGQPWALVVRVGINVSDADAGVTGDVVTLSMSDGPAWVHATPLLRAIALSGTPPPGALASPTPTITLLATDGTGLSSPATLTLVVSNNPGGGCVVCATGSGLVVFALAGTPAAVPVPVDALFTVAPGASAITSYTATMLPPTPPRDCPPNNTACTCAWVVVAYDAGLPPRPRIDGVPPKGAAVAPCTLAVMAVNADGYNATAVAHINVTNINGPWSSITQYRARFPRPVSYGNPHAPNTQLAQNRHGWLARCRSRCSLAEPQRW